MTPESARITIVGRPIQEGDRMSQSKRGSITMPRDAYDAPMTAIEADDRAKTYGFHLVNLSPGLMAGRFIATFFPIDDGDKRAVLADGRTAGRSLSRGVEFCRRLARQNGVKA